MIGQQILNCRRNGLTYREICLELKCPKSTVAYWIKNYSKLSIEELKNLQERRKQINTDARVQAIISSKAALAIKKQITIATATTDFNKFISEPLFVLGLGIYLGEGRKCTTVSLSNLDIDIIKIFIKWSKRYLVAVNFSGSISMIEGSQYSKTCQEVSKLLDLNIKWDKTPKIDPRSKKTNLRFRCRSYGVIEIRITDVPFISLKVQTWMQNAKGL